MQNNTTRNTLQRKFSRKDTPGKIILKSNLLCHTRRQSCNMRNEKKENAPITGTIPAELREAVEDYRWKNRLTVSEVVREAMETWAQSKGIVGGKGKDKA